MQVCNLKTQIANKLLMQSTANQLQEQLQEHIFPNFFSTELRLSWLVEEMGQN